MLFTLLPIVTEVKPEQPAKADSPMLVTLLGIVTEVKPEQSQKAPSPMLVTLLPIVTEVKPEHNQYLQPVITQYFVRNKSEICHRPLRVHSKG